MINQKKTIQNDKFKSSWKGLNEKNDGNIAERTLLCKNRQVTQTATQGRVLVCHQQEINHSIGTKKIAFCC